MTITLNLSAGFLFVYFEFFFEAREEKAVENVVSHE